MADQETLTSAAPPAADGATGTESSHGEQPSTGATNDAAAPVAGGQVDLKTLTKDQLADLWENPTVREEIARRAQAQKDRELRDAERRWQQTREAERAAEAARQQREATLAADEYDLGKQAKQQAEEAKLRERFYAEFEQQYGPQFEDFGRQRAIDYFFGEMGAALNKIDWWSSMNQDEKTVWLRQHANPGEAFVAVYQHGTSREKKRVETEMAKLREASEQETRAAERAGEASPDLGGGAPAGGRLSEREYQANRHNQAWVNANMDRLKEAASRGFA